MEFAPHTLLLADGRRLAYATLGPADGFPVVYLHGGIGTALTPEPGLIETVRRHGVQWVALSRPGFGGSDRHPGRTLASVAADVRALAAARGWPRIALVGVSSGAPYALACAAALPELVAAVALAAGLSAGRPPHLVAGVPRSSRLFLRALAECPERSIRVLDRAARWLCRHERLVVRLAGRSRGEAVRALSAAVAAGVRGPVEDYLLATAAAPLDLSRITAEVHVWHGLRDRLAPAEHAWQLAGALPRCRMWVDPAETHFFFRRRSAEIAAALVTAARAADVPVDPLPGGSRDWGSGEAARTGCVPGAVPR